MPFIVPLDFIGKPQVGSLNTIKTYALYAQAPLPVSVLLHGRLMCTPIFSLKILVKQSMQGFQMGFFAGGGVGLVV